MMRNRFRHRADFERFSTEDVGGGCKEKKWNTLYANEPCLIQPMSGNESFSEGKMTVITTHKIYVRFLSLLVEKDRIKFTDRNNQVRYFEIIWIRNRSELNQTMRVDCLEKDYKE